MDKFNLVIGHSDPLFLDHISKQIDNSLYNVTQAETCFSKLLKTCKAISAKVLFIQKDLIEEQDWPKLQALTDSTEVVLLSKNKVDAAKAFECELFDFILEPIATSRLGKTLDKLARLLVPEKQQFDFVSSLIKKVLPRRAEEQQIVLKDAGRIKVLTLDEISWVGGAGNYVELHLENDDRPVLHRQTLSSMEQQLSPFGFIRIHRSALIKRQAIREIRPTDNGDYIVTLKCGKNLNLSRRYKQNMQELIS